MKKERIKWIDIYKGFLIILVVIGHVISSYKGVGISNNYYKITSSIIYSFHMASFIFISGYLCKVKDEESRKKQILNKLIAYGIPYIIFSFLWVVFKLIFNKYTNTSISITDLLFIIIFPISFMWYIYATMLMNIVQIIMNKLKKIIPIILSIIFIISVPIITQLYPDFSKFILCDFMSFWLYFLLGHYYGDKIINLTSKKIIIIISIILFVLFNYFYFYSSLIDKSYYKIITSLSGIIITLSIFKGLISNNILEYFGKKSLSIYVIQGIVIAITRIVISKIIFLNDVYGIIPLIICTISGLICPLLFEYIIGKIWKMNFILYPNKYIK